MEIDFAKLLEKFRIPLGIVLSICAVISGVLFFQRSETGEEEMRFLTQEELEEVKGLNQVNLEAGKVLVDIAGQVNSPGVIEVEQGSSLLEVVELAGGFSESVDMIHVHKDMNLSQIVEDRQKIYVPSVEERVVASCALADGSAGGIVGKININTASASELEAIAGIGPSTAQKIVEGRPYDSIEGIMDVGGIGEATFEKLKDQITI